MPRFILSALFALITFTASPLLAETYQELFPDLAADPDLADVAETFKDMNFQRDHATLSNKIAELNLGEDYYFLDQKDANYVLEELWGNPHDTSVLGMVFPADVTPLHDTWGMVLSYDDMGHVSDEDAQGYDYDALLSEMKNDTREDSKWRVENGYDSIALVGWAEPPHYDQAGRKLYWAQELQFGTEEEHTLNYNIRALGREGVLILNVVASMGQLDEVRDATPDLLAMTIFTEGNRYADFKPGVDKLAAVGIGGLIAGKVVAKTGMLVVLLAFLKKGFVLLLLPLIWLKNLFTRRRGTAGQQSQSSTGQANGEDDPSDDGDDKRDG